MAPLGQMFIREPQPRKWVFILGCYNSGTTLLHEILARHASVGSMPAEGQEFTRQLPKGSDFRLPRLWALKPDLFYLDENSASPIDTRRLRKEWAWFYNDPSRPVLLEKTILNAARSRWLQKEFPGSHFISIFRNGYAVTEGISRKEGHPLKNSATQWAVSNEILLRDMTFLSHHHVLYYEDLVAQPVKALHGITDFLGLPPLPESVFTGEFDIHRLKSGIRDMNKESIARLASADIGLINEVAGATLVRLGYKVIDPHFSA